MPPTLQVARHMLRDSLGETNARAWTDTQLDQWIWEGCADLAQKTESLQAVANIAVTAGTQQITAPTDMIRAYRIEWNTTGDSRQIPLEYRDFNNADAVWFTSQTTTTGTPLLFTLWGMVPTLKIVLYPTPSATGHIRVYYYRLPTSPLGRLTVGGDPILSDTVTLDCPEGWHDAALLYAEAKALRRDRDPRWQEAKSLYDEKVGILFDLSRTWTDQPGQTVGITGGSPDSWLWTAD